MPPEPSPSAAAAAAAAATAATTTSAAAPAERKPVPSRHGDAPDAGAAEATRSAASRVREAMSALAGPGLAAAALGPKRADGGPGPSAAEEPLFVSRLEALQVMRKQLECLEAEEASAAAVSQLGSAFDLGLVRERGRTELNDWVARLLSAIQVRDVGTSRFSSDVEDERELALRLPPLTPGGAPLTVGFKARTSCFEEEPDSDDEEGDEDEDEDEEEEGEGGDGEGGDGEGGEDGGDGPGGEGGGAGAGGAQPNAAGGAGAAGGADGEDADEEDDEDGGEDEDDEDWVGEGEEEMVVDEPEEEEGEEGEEEDAALQLDVAYALQCWRTDLTPLSPATLVSLHYHPCMDHEWVPAVEEIHRMDDEFLQVATDGLLAPERADGDTAGLMLSAPSTTPRKSKRQRKRSVKSTFALSTTVICDVCERESTLELAVDWVALRTLTSWVAPAMPYDAVPPVLPFRDARIRDFSHPLYTFVASLRLLAVLVSFSSTPLGALSPSQVLFDVLLQDHLALVSGKTEDEYYEGEDSDGSLDVD